MVAFVAASIVVSAYQHTIVHWIDPWKQIIRGFCWTRFVAFVIVVVCTTPPLERRSLLELVPCLYCFPERLAE